MTQREYSAPRIRKNGVDIRIPIGKGNPPIGMGSSRKQATEGTILVGNRGLIGFVMGHLSKNEEKTREIKNQEWKKKKN